MTSIALFSTALASLALTSGCGAHKIPPETTNLKQSWKTQVAQRIAAAKTSPVKGGFYFDEVSILERLLNESPANTAAAASKYICALETIPNRSGNDRDLDANYNTFLLQALIDHSIERKNTRGLVMLLSHHCPRYIVYTPLEFILAAKCQDSINPLFDSYVAAKSRPVRNDIIACLARAFPALRARSPSDPEFIKQAQAWFTGNRSRVQVNPLYQYLVAQPPPRPGEDRTNLFVPGSK
jgi:hypothetical protein